MAGCPASACTPYGCMKLIESTGIDLRGKHAVVIGRSNTSASRWRCCCCRPTPPSPSATARTPTRRTHAPGRRRGRAVGARNVLTADMVKPGAVVIDVGMNRNDEGKLCGDVDFAGVARWPAGSRPCPAASAR
jgi:methylenetetrahydrofolate dehydrogenase (NADP+)/methenyltetrahydrofolate cyclohydrolase